MSRSVNQRATKSPRRATSKKATSKKATSKKSTAKKSTAKSQRKKRSARKTAPSTASTASRSRTTRKRSTKPTAKRRSVRKVKRTSRTAEILFLGTGNAFNTDGRFSQSILVEAQGASPFLVDAGPTVLAAMASYGAPTQDLDRIFVTHLHGDHIAGWPFLAIDFLFTHRRTKPLDAFGPPGTRAHLTALTGLCYGEIFSAERQAFPVNYHEFPVEEQLDLDAGEGLRVDTFPMDHHPSSIGYCFHIGDEVLGITGDTRWCPNLEKLAQRSNVLVMECTSVDEQEYAHVSLAEIRKRRETLGDGKVILVHLSDAVAQTLKKHPIDGVKAASDGRRMTL